MAGKGTRTHNLGAFKPFIKIGKYEIIKWLLTSIGSHVRPEDQFFVVTTREFDAEFEVSSRLRKIFGDLGLLVNLTMVIAEDTPPGPAASVSLVAENIRKEDDPVVSVNVDQFIHFEMNDFKREECGFLPVYAEFTNKASYCDIVDGRVMRVVEKNNISNLASAGVYGCSSTRLFFEMLFEHLESDNLTNGEHYIGPAYNILINKGIPVVPGNVFAKYDLGNLKSIERFRSRMLQNLGYLSLGGQQVY